MNQITQFVDRARVVATAAVTWLAALAFIVEGVVAELGDEIPAVAEYGGRALTWIALAVAVIRRVTPVRSDDKGLLPDGGV